LKHVGDLYRFSLYIFVDQQVLFLSRRLDEALVASCLGVSDLGVYSIAKRVVLTLQDALETPLGQVLIPAFSRLQSSMSELLILNRKTLSLLMALGLPAFLGLAAMAPEALNILFGPRWLEASTATRLLAPGAAASMIGIAVYPVFLAIGKPQVLLGINTASAAVGALLLIVGVGYGSAGVAAAITLRQFIMAIVSIVILKNLIAMKVEIGVARAVAVPAIGGILCAASARMAIDVLSFPSAYLSIGMATLICSGVYIGLIRVLDPPFAREFYTSTMEVCRGALNFSYKKRKI
jgi:PST family polysaccharide transporter